MKVITNLAGQTSDVDCSQHPIRQAIRSGVHVETKSGVFRFVGIWDTELHLHHGKSIVSIPLAELWKLAENADPDFKKDHPPIVKIGSAPRPIVPSLLPPSSSLKEIPSKQPVPVFTNPPPVSAN